MIKVKSYKDYDGHKVYIGDFIEEVNYDGTKRKNMGTVIEIYKQGFFVHPQTTLTHRKEQLWGKFTRKVTKQ